MKLSHLVVLCSSLLVCRRSVSGFSVQGPSQQDFRSVTTATVCVSMTTASTTSESSSSSSDNDNGIGNSPSSSSPPSPPQAQAQEKQQDIATAAVVKPDILLPFAPAADPNYINTGLIGQGDFIISRTGGPTREELTNDNIRKIVEIQCTDLEVNTLIWKCLGYRFEESSQTWTADECFPNWREKYPTPPDLIGMQRIYEKEIDQPSLRANQSLVRSIPVEHKLSLKKHLRPLGWKGYQYSELTPNKTRRAQCANWIVFFREELFGRTLQELKAAREAKKAAQEAAKKEGEPEEWKPPVREVY